MNKIMRFKKITVCLDMYGCPNRCKHCWIGHSPNGNLTIEDLKYTASQFRPYTSNLIVDSWYREPDYKDNYKELWDICNELSDTYNEHFELISVWRIVRDNEYVKWLSSKGLKTAQLTLFGGQEKTDYYTGRKNAYNEILEAIGILLENGISPRIQVFINKDNIDELAFIEYLIKYLRLEERCKSIGGEFSLFLHQGTCDGENEKLYDIRITPEDLNKIPKTLIEYTLKHFGKTDLAYIFGQTEQELCKELLNDNSTANFVNESPVFYVDKSFNVYPNIAPPEPSWYLGNLKADGVETVLQNYTDNRSVAQRTRLTVPLCRLAESEGNIDSQKLFSRGDYIEYLLNRYCRK